MLIDYLYTDNLKKEQWAWEFLRRNQAYQADYQWFISQWKALEKDYGVSPNIDYQAWKQDPRSYKIIDISSDQDGNCAISDDKLLIECWMGNKWGFYQFPQSPQLCAQDINITWRPLYLNIKHQTILLKLIKMSSYRVLNLISVNPYRNNLNKSNIR